MNSIINWIENWIETVPLPLLEGWGTFAYIVGLALAIAAYGGFTFRPGGRWGFGRERQAWDSKAFLSMPLTFVLIIATGYFGSFIVLVPGAQTFESLKDLVVFLCVVLFGFPALLIVPFAYGLSDLIEGVPPGSLLEWLPGYFINPACFWIAYQLFGKNPDFRKTRTWAKYLLFVVLFLSIEPVLWGYICSGKFTPPISYGSITSALFFTTGITWIIAPFAMLAAFPLARRFGMFWAEIPGHVKERFLRSKEWVWEAGGGQVGPHAGEIIDGWPLRIVIVSPFIALVLLMVGVTAFVTLRNAQNDANKLALRLHQEISDNIDLKLDEYLANAPVTANETNYVVIDQMLRSLPISVDGLALIVDGSGKIVASSTNGENPVAARAVAVLSETAANSAKSDDGLLFHFDVITEKPLTSAAWLARAARYQDRLGGHNDWIIITLMPESYYMAGVQAGNSGSALVFAIALLLSIVMAAFLASKVTGRLRQISLASQALAQGDLSQRAPGSRMEELGNLALSFNYMAERLKKSFDDVREAKEFNAQVLANTQHGLVVLDHELRYVMWNPTMEKITGLSPEQVLGKRPQEMFPFLAKAGVIDAMYRALEGQITHTDDFQYDIPATGRHGWVATLVGPMRNSSGEIIGVINSIIEITARLQEEHFVNTLMDTLPGNVYLFQADGKFLKWNKVLEDVTGYTSEEIENMSPLAFVPESEIDCISKSIELVLSEGQDSVESYLLTKDGTPIPYYYKGVRMHTEQGPCVLGIGIDISGRRHLEDQIRQAQKMEAVGQLAGGIAHDFNNLLTIITGYCQLILRSLQPNDPQEERVREILQAGERSASLTRQLLTFSRKQVLAPKILNLNDIVHDTDKMLRRLIGEDVRLTTTLSPMLDNIRADPGQIEQVLINLALNARDAMPQGGELSIETRNVAIDTGYPMVQPDVRLGAHVMLTVVDTGVGMTDDIKARIFEPFFTTKGAGKGTGLGMAVVHGIVKQSEGYIEVESEPGIGTSFKIYLPNAPDDKRSPFHDSFAPAPHGSETILLVEDETVVRALSREVLHESGYKVLEASDGESALRLSAEYEGEIDLLVADVVMPGVSGPALAERIVEFRPKIKILYVSGYTDDAVVKHGVLHDEVKFLQKPFSPDALAHKVRDVLDSA